MNDIGHDPHFTIGMTAYWHGQAYELVGYKLHPCRDGHDTILLVWRSHCALCGATFETATLQRELQGPSRRCALHKAPGKRA